MKSTLRLLLLFFTVNLFCTDAYEYEYCQLTFILTLINERLDTVKVSIEQSSKLIENQNDTTITIPPLTDFVFIASSKNTTRDGCYFDCEDYSIKGNIWINKDGTNSFDSLFQVYEVILQDDVNDIFYKNSRTNAVKSQRVIIE